MSLWHLFQDKRTFRVCIQEQSDILDHDSSYHFGRKISVGSRACGGTISSQHVVKQVESSFR